MLQQVPRPFHPQTPPASPSGPAADSSDTLSFVEHLRDHPFQTSDLEAFFFELGEAALDPAVWAGLAGLFFRVLLILLLAWLAVHIVDQVTARWSKRFEEFPETHPRRQRALTISNLLSSTTRYVAWPLALIMILSEVNVDVGALLATAGIAGLAIGFGAQTLVRDVISGVFLLFDDTLHVGDLVRVGEDTGTVEYIGVRLIKVRKFDGELMMIPAGELRIFGNRSIGFVRVIVEIGLPYEQDVDTMLSVLQRIADEWAAERRHILLEKTPQVQALLGFGDSALQARIVVQVRPGEQWQAERDLRLKIRRAFDRAGIEIPFPRRTVYMREEKQLPAAPADYKTRGA